MVKTPSSTQGNGASQTKRLCVRSPSSVDTKLKPFDTENNRQRLVTASQSKTTTMTASIDLPLKDSDQTTQNHLDSSGDLFLPHIPATSSKVHSDSSSSHDTFNLNELLESILKKEADSEIQVSNLLILRNHISACKKSKKEFINHPSHGNIVDLLDSPDICNEQKTQIALLFCSTVKFKNENNHELDNDIVAKILKLIYGSSCAQLLEACLRCLRSVLSCSTFGSIIKILYDDSVFQTITIKDSKNNLGIKKLIDCAFESSSLVVQECVLNILSLACKSHEYQNIIWNANFAKCLTKFIESPSSQVSMSALVLLSHLCFRNTNISDKIYQYWSNKDESILERLVFFMDKTMHSEIQLFGATCYVYIFKSRCMNFKLDTNINCVVIPTLVRMMHPDKQIIYRIKAAESLSYLIRDESELQSLTSIHNNLIQSLAVLLELLPDSLYPELKSLSALQIKLYENPLWCTTSHGFQFTCEPLEDYQRNKPSHTDEVYELNNFYQRKTQASLMCLEALCSSQEEVRLKVTSVDSIITSIYSKLNEKDINTVQAALSCLTSLSRSIRLLRTSFTKIEIHLSLKSLLTSESPYVLRLVLAVLCNLVMDFSTGKHHYLERGTIRNICELSKHPDYLIRWHSIWILMNMANELDLDLKLSILSYLNMERIYILLSEKNEDIILKTLGLLRNLLSKPEHTYVIMNDHGNKIIHAAIFILDSEEAYITNRVKEEAMVIVCNIADGIESRCFILSQEVLLSKVVNLIGGNDERLELASAKCITSLACDSEDGFHERRNILRKLGLVEKLESRAKTKNRKLNQYIERAYKDFLPDKSNGAII